MENFWGEILVGFVFIFFTGFAKVLYDKFNRLEKTIDIETKELHTRVTNLSTTSTEHSQKIMFLEKEMQSHTNTTNRIFEMLDAIQEAITNIEKLLAKNQIQ